MHPTSLLYSISHPTYILSFLVKLSYTTIITTIPTGIAASASSGIGSLLYPGFLRALDSGVVDDAVCTSLPLIFDFIHLKELYPAFNYSSYIPERGFPVNHALVPFHSLRPWRGLLSELSVLSG